MILDSYTDVFDENSTLEDTEVTLELARNNVTLELARNNMTLKQQD